LTGYTGLINKIVVLDSFIKLHCQGDNNNTFGFALSYKKYLTLSLKSLKVYFKDIIKKDSDRINRIDGINYFKILSCASCKSCQKNCFALLSLSKDNFR